MCDGKLEHFSLYKSHQHLLFTNLTNTNDHHQVKDCPLSETSDGGDDEEVCEASAAGVDDSLEYL